MDDKKNHKKNTCSSNLNCCLNAFVTSVRYGPHQSIMYHKAVAYILLYFIYVVWNYLHHQEVVPCLQVLFKDPAVC